MKNLYPVNLDLNGRVCVVIGGGVVAGRKVHELLICGARVVIISPEISGSLAALVDGGNADWRQRGYRNGDLEGAFLVFAVTDNRDVQRAVCEEARMRGILINTADAPASCSFHVPARVRRGNLLLTVSTGGGSPALAARIRRQLEETFGPEYEQYVRLLAGIRARILEDGKDTASHTLMFRRILRLDILGHLQRQDQAALIRDLASVLPDSADVEKLIEGLWQ